MMNRLILCILVCIVEMMEMPDPGREPLLSPGVITLKEDRSLLLTEVNWQLIRVQRLAPYEELALKLTSTLETLEKIMSKGPRSQESQNRPLERKFIRALEEGLLAQVRGAQGVLHKVRNDIVDLLENIELYQGCHSGRVPRAVFSFMGLIMHDMFGVMDENGERLVRNLDASVKEVIHLQKSQASIVAGLLTSFQATSARVGDIESKLIYGKTAAVSNSPSLETGSWAYAPVLTPAINLYRDYDTAMKSQFYLPPPILPRYYQKTKCSITWVHVFPFVMPVYRYSIS
ncbi:uncharacterized protein LOC134776278 [Penaeus indicus]|uniref:uncharacterized protein LOC134776278 n=1 Tax=Penaeus indicus TaxID=29960 RepID=UPI00300D1B8F